MIIMTKGLPGSGKSTWAKQYIKDHPKSMRINKDDIRSMAFANYYRRPNEKQVIELRDLMVKVALNAGMVAIVDDTNLNPIHQRRLSEIAEEKGVPLVIQNFLDVPVEKCIENDLKREKSVGKDVIIKMRNQYLMATPPRIEHDPALEDCIICDIDGTLALFGEKSPYERDFINDKVNTPVRDVLHAYMNNRSEGYCHTQIILFSGRNEKFKKETEEWLEKNAIPHDQLYMRPEGDARRDSQVKTEMYDQIVKGNYNVLFVLDDRNQVVELWRSLGLTCFQVSPGDF